MEPAAVSDLFAGAAMAPWPLAVLGLVMSILFHAIVDHEDDLDG